MSENMGVRVEVWPLAADETGIWLLSGLEPWMSVPVPQDSDPHFEVEQLMYMRAGIMGAALIHSPSWRPSGPHTILTYMVVLDVPTATVLESWPNAKPIGPELLESFGPTATHAADNAPTPRRADVLVHGIRHLRLLQEFDATSARALPAAWDSHLTGMRPALAGWYAAEHASPAT